MVWPKISIIWVNYNSINVIDLVLESLRAISEINYPYDRYELIVVDNGSTDGSFKVIKDFLEKKGGLQKKIIKLERNRGFTGGNNVGFRCRDKDSKYVCLINNDAIPLPDSLRDLVEYSEMRDDIGAVQGIILDLETKKVDTAGDMLNELLIACQLYHARPPSSVKKSIYITYADGAFALLKVDSVKEATGSSDQLFFDDMFAYFDDSVLGLQLWNSGFKVISYPTIVALHRRSSTFGKESPFKVYLSTRGYFALNEICNSKFKDVIRSTFFLRAIRRYITYLLSSKLFKEYKKVLPRVDEMIYAFYKGYIDGVRWGRMKIIKGITLIDLYKAPLIRDSLLTLKALITGAGLDFARKMFTLLVTEDFESNLHDYIAE